MAGINGIKLDVNRLLSDMDVQKNWGKLEKVKTTADLGQAIQNYAHSHLRMNGDYNCDKETSEQIYAFGQYLKNGNANVDEHIKHLGLKAALMKLEGTIEGSEVQYDGQIDLGNFCYEEETSLADCFSQERKYEYKNLLKANDIMDVPVDMWAKVSKYVDQRLPEADKRKFDKSQYQINSKSTSVRKKARKAHLAVFKEMLTKMIVKNDHGELICKEDQ